MLCAPACPFERRLYSATLYPTNFTLDSLLTLKIAPSARLMASVSPCLALWPVGDFSCDCMFWDERGRGLTRQPVCPFGDTASMTTAINTNRVDSGSFSSRYCAFWRTYTRSADPIRLLCIRLALPLTLSLPS